MFMYRLELYSTATCTVDKCTLLFKDDKYQIVEDACLGSIVSKFNAWPIYICVGMLSSAGQLCPYMLV